MPAQWVVRIRVLAVLVVATTLHRKELRQKWLFGTEWTPIRETADSEPLDASPPSMAQRVARTVFLVRDTRQSGEAGMVVATAVSPRSKASYAIQAFENH